MTRYLINTNKNTLLSKVFTTYVVLLPILQYYKSPVPSLNFATFLAVAFLPILIISQQGIILYNKHFLPITVYSLFILFNVILTTILYNHSISMEYDGAFLRMILLFVSILYVGHSFFDIKRAEKVLEIMLLASAGFMIIQFASFFLSGRFLVGNISILLTNEGYRNTSRATGFYMEPAQYAQSAALYLCLKLFSNSSLDWKKIIVVFFGVVMSGSGQGYLYLLMIAILYFLEFNKKLSQRKLLYGFFVIISVFVVIVLLYRIPYIQLAIERIFPNDDGSFGGVALQGRTYTNKYFYLLSDLERMWGVGFGLSQSVIPSSKEAYINTLFVHLIECGYVSILVWAFMLIYSFLMSPLETRVFILIYIVMLYFSGMGRPMMICYFFSFILHKYNEKNNNRFASSVYADSNIKKGCDNNASE